MLFLIKIGVALVQGVTISGLIYALGHVSGAHFNPVVTLSFSLRGDFHWALCPVYLLSEFAGTIIIIISLCCFSIYFCYF